MGRLAQVCCAGISYGVRTALLDPEGEQVVNEAGVKQWVNERKEARLGEVVELSDAEFAFHAKLGGVQEPDSSPLPGSPGAPVIATPFGVPVAVDETGVLTGFKGPVMGDPRPAGAGLTDTELLTPGRGDSITAEQAAALEAQAAGNTGENLGPGDLDIEDATVDEVREFIIDNKLSVADTVELAGEDPEFAAKVLEAEEAGKSRVTVVDALTKIVESDDEDDD